MTVLSIVIPCYNEVDNITRLKDELLGVIQDLAKDQSVEIIFVDDGSTDGTYPAFIEVFGDLNLLNIQFIFLKHDVNRGLGAALRTGFARVSGDTSSTG